MVMKLKIDGRSSAARAQKAAAVTQKHLDSMVVVRPGPFQLPGLCEDITKRPPCEMPLGVRISNINDKLRQIELELDEALRNLKA